MHINGIKSSQKIYWVLGATVQYTVQKLSNLALNWSMDRQSNENSVCETNPDFILLHKIMICDSS